MNHLQIIWSKLSAAFGLVQCTVYKLYRSSVCILCKETYSFFSCFYFSKDIVDCLIYEQSILNLINLLFALLTKKTINDPFVIGFFNSGFYLTIFIFIVFQYLFIFILVLDTFMVHDTLLSTQIFLLLDGSVFLAEWQIILFQLYITVELVQCFVETFISLGDLEQEWVRVDLLLDLFVFPHLKQFVVVYVFDLPLFLHIHFYYLL